MEYLVERERERERDEKQEPKIHGKKERKLRIFSQEEREKRNHYVSHMNDEQSKSSQILQ